MESSDDVVIPLEEFRHLIDGAVRIARCEGCTISCTAISLALPILCSE